jgi:hypothetical protein
LENLRNGHAKLQLAALATLVIRDSIPCSAELAHVLEVSLLQARRARWRRRAHASVHASQPAGASQPCARRRRRRRRSELASPPGSWTEALGMHVPCFSTVHGHRLPLSLCVAIAGGSQESELDICTNNIYILLLTRFLAYILSRDRLYL